MPTISEQLRAYLQYIAVPFLNHPEKAQLRMATLSDGHLKFRLIAEREDVPRLIGKNGMTVSAIRSLLKAAAEREKIKASLLVVSHEEADLPDSELSPSED